MDGRVTLPRGTLLADDYCIERVIGSGGFGITYEAEDVKLRARVAIKEYYPVEFGDRDLTMSVRPRTESQRQTFEWGRSSFLAEAQTLVRFRHPSIVRVTRVFEANSTAYMVMELEEGRDFGAWLRELDRPPMQDELDQFVAPLLEALALMHTNHFLHRDIAPDNVIIRDDGTPVLLDFGAARRAVAQMTRTVTGIVKPGFSPVEQYSTDVKEQGPWSDLYALGATLYLAVTGNLPDEAPVRSVRDRVVAPSQLVKGEYRPEFLNGIWACLKVKPSERPQSVAELRQLLCPPEQRTRKPVVSAVSRRASAPAQAPTSVFARGTGKRPLVAGVAIALLLAGSYAGISTRKPCRGGADPSISGSQRQS